MTITTPAAVISPLMGVNLTQTDTTARFAVGTVVKGAASAEYVYGKASAAITGYGYVVWFDNDSVATMATTANTANKRGSRVGIALGAMSANDYGWFQVAGAAPVRVLASCAIAVAVNTTATAGALDDDATASSRVINGLYLVTANGGSAANADAYLDNATIGATL